MADLSDEDLLAALGIEAEPVRQSSRSAQEERIIAGFEDIQKFVDQHRRLPALDDGGEIFERIYATRLARLRSLPDCRAVLAPLDRQGLLTESPDTAPNEPLTSDEDLLMALGITPDAEALTELRHVRSSADKRAAEEVA